MCSAWKKRFIFEVAISWLWKHTEIRKISAQFFGKSHPVYGKVYFSQRMVAAFSESALILSFIICNLRHSMLFYKKPVKLMQ